MHKCTQTLGRIECTDVFCSHLPEIVHFQFSELRTMVAKLNMKFVYRCDCVLPDMRKPFVRMPFSRSPCDMNGFLNQTTANNIDNWIFKFPLTDPVNHDNTSDSSCSNDYEDLITYTNIGTLILVKTNRLQPETVCSSFRWTTLVQSCVTLNRNIETKTYDAVL